MKSRLFTFLLLSCFTSFGQPWPKLVREVNGSFVQIKYDYTVGWSYEDWKGLEIPGFTVDFSKGEPPFLFIDSTGNPISGDRYSFAQSFVDGLAIVQSIDKNGGGVRIQNAAINTRAAIVLPYSASELINIGDGFISKMHRDTTEVFDGTGRIVTWCTGCEAQTNSQFRHILLIPRQGGRNEPVIRVLDYLGRELWRRAGRTITQGSNHIYDGRNENIVMQPFYVVQNNELNSAVKPDGVTLLDSLSYIHFGNGKATIKKDGFAAVVDSNFKEIMPFRLGYKNFFLVFGYPTELYSALSDNGWILVDRRNRQLIPFAGPGYFNYLKDVDLLECRGTNEYWVLSSQGDTIVDPSIFHFETQLTHKRGFIVRSMANHKYGLLSPGGKIEIPCHYDYLCDAGEKQLSFFTGNRGGFLDWNGKEVISIEGGIQLGNFINGYTMCDFKVTDPKLRSPIGREVFIVGPGGSYSVRSLLLDSTGKFVTNELVDYAYPFQGDYCMVEAYGANFLIDRTGAIVRIGKHGSVVSYFHHGYAVAYDPVNKKFGLVNEKTELVLPLMYNWLDTKPDETGRFSYRFCSNPDNRNEFLGFRNFYANIKDSKLKVKQKGKEFVVDIK
jgi:hypothetical protein